MTPIKEAVWSGPDAFRGSLIAIADLEPWPGNPRQGDVGAISESLKRFGQLRLIVVRGARIVAGHHIVLAAKALGWTHVAVVDPEQLADEEEARAFLIADNRTAELGYTDDSLLVAQLEALNDRSGTGYSGDDLDDLRATVAALQRLDNPRDPDAVPETPARPVSKRGEVYMLGEHRLMCGDATSADDVAKLMGDAESVLAFTSPPYLDLRTYGGDKDLSLGTLSGFLDVWADFADLIAVNLGLVMRENEIVRYWDAYLDEARAAGLKLLAWNVWNREDATSMASQRMMFPLWHEWVFVFGERSREANRILPTKNAGRMSTRAQRLPNGEFTPPRTYPVATMKRLGSVLTSPSHKGPSAGDHPAVFPIALPVAYIESVTQPGDLVVDPFVGSGSTLVAAEQTGRRCYGMELDERWVDVARQRYADYTGQPELAPRRST